MNEKVIIIEFDPKADQRDYGVVGDAGKIIGEARLTTEHAASSYGQPVLLLNNKAYGVGDMPKNWELANPHDEDDEGQRTAYKECAKAISAFRGLH